MQIVDIAVPDNIGDAEECVIVTWLKRPGDQVAKDDVLVILQAAKVSFEIAAPVDGQLTAILAVQGEVVKERQVIARLEASAAAIVVAPQAPVATTAAAATPSASAREVRASPIAKRMAKEHNIDLALVPGSGEGGRITEKDIQAYLAAQRAALPPAASPAPVAPSEPARAVVASPVAKRLAKEHNLDLAGLVGSGEGGRITEKDVQTALAARQPAMPPAPVASPAGPTITTLPFTPLRATIARRLQASLQNTAQVTLTATVDVTELAARRAQMKAQVDLSYTDLLIKAVTLALKAHPPLNGWAVDNELRMVGEMHIGVAVALEEGLVVPVVRHADRQSLAALAQETARLAQGARTNSLTPAELSGSTFTITNLGMYGIDSFTPILNPPEVAILGVGRIHEQLTRRGHDLLWRQMMTLSLTIDHRVIDGAPGARFLQSLREVLETPTWMA